MTLLYIFANFFNGCFSRRQLDSNIYICNQSLTLCWFGGSMWGKVTSYKYVVRKRRIVFVAKSDNFRFLKFHTLTHQVIVLKDYWQCEIWNCIKFCFVWHYNPLIHTLLRMSLLPVHHFMTSCIGKYCFIELK